VAAGIFVLLLVPTLEQWVSHHVMGTWSRSGRAVTQE